MRANKSKVSRELLKSIKKYPLSYPAKRTNTYLMVGMIAGAFLGIVLDVYIWKYINTNKIDRELFSYWLRRYNSLYFPRSGPFWVDVSIVPIFMALTGSFLGKLVESLVKKRK